eukprot:26107_1
MICLCCMIFVAVRMYIDQLSPKIAFYGIIGCNWSGLRIFFIFLFTRFVSNCYYIYRSRNCQSDQQWTQSIELIMICSYTKTNKSDKFRDFFELAYFFFF